MNARTKAAMGGGAAVIGALVWWTTHSSANASDTTLTRERPVEVESVTPVTVARPTSNLPSDAPPAPGAARDGLIVASYGSRPGELGRDRPEEGNPQGPSSLAFAGRDLIVLDQVNERGVRYDANGKVIGVFDAPSTAQEIAVAPDGKMALMDRLGHKVVTLTDPSGKKIGELPLKGETGLYTGVFFDGNDVYAEKEHGALVKLGSTDGAEADEHATTLQGRPSRDGTLLLGASLASSATGKIAVNAYDRKTNALRFARVIRVAPPAETILLLDTDARGVIYVGVRNGDPDANEATIACLQPSDGKAIGRVTVPLSTVPEETFRDLTVSNEGVIAYAVHGEEGVTYRTTRCP